MKCDWCKKRKATLFSEVDSYSMQTFTMLKTLSKYCRVCFDGDQDKLITENEYIIAETMIS